MILTEWNLGWNSASSFLPPCHCQWLFGIWDLGFVRYERCQNIPKQPFLFRVKVEGGISLVVWLQAKTPQSLEIFLVSAGFEYHSSSKFMSPAFHWSYSELWARGFWSIWMLNLPMFCGKLLPLFIPHFFCEVYIWEDVLQWGLALRATHRCWISDSPPVCAAGSLWAHRGCLQERLSSTSTFHGSWPVLPVLE